MVNIEDGPSSGYVLRYDDEIIVEVGKGEFTNLLLNHFGEGGGCSEAPSEALLVSSTVFVVVRSFVSYAEGK